MNGTNKRKSDEVDSTIALCLNYLLAGGVVIAIMVAAGMGWDQSTILDGVIIGIMLSKSFDWVTKSNEYFFPTNRAAKSVTNNGETNEGKRQDQEI